MFFAFIFFEKKHIFAIIMRIENITYPDVNNGTGCRVTLWIAGCSHHCAGCHNKETWDFNSGREFTKEDKDKLFEILSLPYIQGLTLSGGDPIDSYNDTLQLAEDVKTEFPNKDIWCYTGYTMEYMRDNYPEILKYIDTLVDGEFHIKEKDVTLAFRGSRNQRIWQKQMNGDFQIFDIENK